MTAIQLFISVAMAISIAIHFAIQIFGALRLRAVYKLIGGTIKSRPDLDQVKAAIQLNLFLGIPVVGNGVLMVVLMSRFSGLWILLICLTIIVVQPVMSLVCRPIYRRFKILPVATGHEDLAAEYNSYVKQWSGFHILLKIPPTQPKV